MAKKTKTTEITAEVINPDKNSGTKRKDKVIEVEIFGEGSLESKVNESLPVLKKSTSLKVQDPLTVYLKEISRHKLLTIEEERELTAELLRTGDIEVARKLVLANLRLVVKIALEYRNSYKNIMDLIQEGNIG